LLAHSSHVTWTVRWHAVRPEWLGMMLSLSLSSSLPRLFECREFQQTMNLDSDYTGQQEITRPLFCAVSYGPTLTDILVT
jgi:hypothetical protein